MVWSHGNESRLPCSCHLVGMEILDSNLHLNLIERPWWYLYFFFLFFFFFFAFVGNSKRSKVCTKSSRGLDSLDNLFIEGNSFSQTIGPG